MSDWRLATRYAVRELRVGLKGFYVFIACLALGVAAIAAVGTLSQSIEAGLRHDARQLNGGDLSISLIQRDVTPDEQEHIAALGPTSRVLEMRAMAAHGDERTLVELKAVDDAYPLAGEVTLQGGGSFRNGLADKGVLVEPTLLAKLDLAVGDAIKIGDGLFTVRGVIDREPDKVASVLNYGPRVMIGSDALPATGLVQPGSQIRYRYRVLTGGADVDTAAATLDAASPHAGWRMTTAEDGAPGISRFIDQLTLFLTFVGLTTLLVGGVGVSNAVASYLDSRLSTIATLKCVGASSGFIFRVYLVQVMALATVGLVIGLAAGLIAPLVAMSALHGLLPVDPVPGLYPRPVIAAAAYGLLIALTFSLLPLARARAIPAAALFRAKLTGGGWPKARDLMAIALAGGALAAFTVLSTPRIGFALSFVVGAAASFGLLATAAVLLKALARRAQGLGGGASLRLALANLHRPGATTTSVVLSLGLGLSVLVAIVLIESNFNRQIENRLSEGAPAFFFLDIQPDQRAAFDAAVTAVPGAADYRRIASLRGRIVAIKGVPVDQAPVAPDVEWATSGDRALTYADTPPDGTKIVRGQWWAADYSGPPLISLDDDVARGFGLQLGDTLTLNILGRDIEGRLANTRAIDWRSMRFDFAVIFSSGIFAGAPHTDIAAIRVPPASEPAMERAVAKGFDNVSVISVRQAVEAARELLSGINVAIGATAGITIAGGVLVLAGAIAAGRKRRQFEAVVFKVLGAVRADILRAFLLEYGLLGLATGLVAAAVGSVVSWAITVKLMELPWSFDLASVALTVAGTVAFALLAGFAGTWRALGAPAAPQLRNE